MIIDSNKYRDKYRQKENNMKIMFQSHKWCDTQGHEVP
jgi:hypothetical protein